MSKIINNKAQIEVINEDNFIREMTRLAFMPESDEIDDFLQNIKSFQDENYKVTEDFAIKIVGIVTKEDIDGNVLYKNYNQHIKAINNNYIEGCSIGYEEAVLSLKSFFQEEFPKFNFKKDYFRVKIL